MNGAAMDSPFERFSPEDARALIAQFPLAWVMPKSSPGDACLLPLLAEHDEDGTVAALVGHMGVRNPLVTAIAAEPQVTALFAGPQGYVSPAHAGRRDWGPTWNYAQLVIEGEAELAAPETDELVERLVAAMEPAPAGWRAAELGARYDAMRRQIIGFRIRVTALRGRFKLGQDECPAVLASILERHPDERLTAWMRRMTAGRA